MKQNKQIKNKTKRSQSKILNNSGNTDFKICETGLSTFSIVSGTVYYMNPIQVGPSYNERVGNKVLNQMLSLRYAVKASTTLIGSTVAVVRVILLRDNRQIDSTAPTSAEVLSAALPNSSFNYLNLGRFSIIYDTYHTVDTYNPVKQVLFERRLGFSSKYSSNALGSITMNGFYMLLLTDNSTNAPTFDYSSRVLFEDN